MKNTIEIANNVVSKTYSSRIDFLREEKIYKQLQGTGLCPKLLYSSDGRLEHEYVDGKTLLDLLSESEGDYSVIATYFEKFYDWYNRFHEATKMNLGRVRFEKFIMKDGKLCGIEFENCKPGYPEEDIAGLVAQMCMIPEAYSEYGISMSMLFVCVGYGNLGWKPDILAVHLAKALDYECLIRGIAPDKNKNEYIITMACSSGIVFSGGKTPITDCTEPLAFQPQRIISSPKGWGIKPSVPGFAPVETTAGLDNTLSRIVETQKKSDQVWSIFLTTDMPRIPKVLWDAQFSCDKAGYAAVVIKAGGKLREFPLILNNSMTRYELENALRNGETSLTAALSALPIKIIVLENL